MHDMGHSPSMPGGPYKKSGGPLMPLNHSSNLPPSMHQQNHRRPPIPSTSPYNYPPKQSIDTKADMVQVRIRTKNNMASNQLGSMSQTLDQQEKTNKKKRDLSQATQRLKVLEQLEQYREEKVRNEMMLLEMQRQQEQKEVDKVIRAEQKKQAYLEKQKHKVAEFQ